MGFRGLKAVSGCIRRVSKGLSEIQEEVARDVSGTLQEGVPWGL